MFLSSYGKNGALEPFEDEAHHHSGRPWLVDESNGFIHPTWFAGFLPTTYDTNPNKTPFSFWENPSKLPYPFHQVWSDPPLTPKVMEKIGVPMGPTVPLSTYLPTETYAPLLIAFQIWSLRFPPHNGTLPSGNRTLPNLTISRGCKLAQVPGLSCWRDLALFWGFHWLDPTPTRMPVSTRNRQNLPRQNWVGFHSNPLVTCCCEITWFYIKAATCWKGLVFAWSKHQHLVKQIFHMHIITYTCM